MPTTRIVRALFPQARTVVLSELTMVGKEGLHLREIARRAGLNSKTVMRELHSLRDAGVLVSKKAGNQVIYRLNPNCPIYDELRSIVRKTVGLAGVLREEFEPFADRIETAYVYGSHARGDARAGSDIDLMIVGDVSLREISSAIRAAGRTLHRIVNPVLYTSDEYASELRADDSFVYRVHDGPRIGLIGGAG